MVTHELMCRSKAFQEIVDCKRVHDFRRDPDKKYHEGDLILLIESVNGEPTGRVFKVIITAISRGSVFQIPKDYVAMSILAFD